MIDAAFIWQILPQLLQAAGTTLILASSAAAIGFVGGTLLGIAQSRGSTSIKSYRYAVCNCYPRNATSSSDHVFFPDVSRHRHSDISPADSNFGNRNQ